MRTLIDDLRQAGRALARSPGLAVTVVLILGLGVGAATVIFSMADAVLLRPLPFADQDRLVAVWGEMRERELPQVEVSLKDYRQWLDGNRSFSDLALLAATDSDLAILGGDQPLHARGRLVSANFFRLLGAEAAHGRTLLPEDDRPGAPDVVIVSHGFWLRHFGADRGAIGRTLSIGGSPRTIVGVMPASFRYPKDADLWSPLAKLAAAPELEELRVFEAIGRLRPGIGVEEARRDMAALSARLDQEREPGLRGYRSTVVPLIDEILGDNRPALHLLLAAVALLLLIACANVAGLLLARAASRRRETALRLALGASRPRLARGLLSEGLLLGLLAAAGGLLFAWGGLHLVSTLGPADVPRLDEAAVDGRTLAFGLLAALATVMLAALVPAAQRRQGDLATALREGGGSSEGARGSRLRDLLVVGEVALALMLLAAAGLVIRTFWTLQQTDLGFRPERVLTFRVARMGGPPNPPQWAAFFRAALERVQALPGIESAGLVLMRPLAGPIGWEYTYAAEGQSEEEAKANPVANQERISPGYFRTMGIPLREGRDFTSTDGPEAPLVAIVNQATARRLWPNGEALGRRIRWAFSGEQPWMTVVGIVGDVHYRDLRSYRPDIYVPFEQDPIFAMDLVIRTRRDPLALAAAAQAAIRSVDPNQPVARITTLEQAVSEAVAHPRMRALLLGLFAGLALLLAAVGLYGLLAYSVARRRRELGIRMALGAGRSDVLGLVLRRGLALALAGIALGGIGVVAFGIAASAGAGGLAGLGNLIYGVEPLDFPTLLGVSLLLLAIAAAATLVPARRASEVDPLIALKSE